MTNETGGGQSLSDLSKALLESLRHASARTRVILLAFNIVAGLTFVAWYNPRFGWNMTRIKVREARLKRLATGATERQGPVNGTEAPKSDVASAPATKPATVDGPRSKPTESIFAPIVLREPDEIELEHLRRIEIERHDELSYPALGLYLSEGDVSLATNLLLIVMLIWFRSCLHREWRILGDIGTRMTSRSEGAALAILVPNEFLFLHREGKDVQAILMIWAPVMIAMFVSIWNSFETFQTIWDASAETLWAELGKIGPGQQNVLVFRTVAQCSVSLFLFAQAVLVWKQCRLVATKLKAIVTVPPVSPAGNATVLPAMPDATSG